MLRCYGLLETGWEMYSEQKIIEGFPTKEMSKELNKNLDSLVIHPLGTALMQVPFDKTYSRLKMEVELVEKNGNWKSGYLFEGIMTVKS